MFPFSTIHPDTLRVSYHYWSRFPGVELQVEWGSCDTCDSPTSTRMASLSSLLQSASSVVFRALAFIYLRIIPARPGYIVVPSAFVAYLGFFLVDTFSPKSSPQPVVTKVDHDEKTNGHSSKDEVDSPSEVDTASIKVSFDNYLM